MNNSRLTFQRFMIAGLEAFVYGLNKNPQAPVVFYLHGLRGSVQDSLKYCNSLAKNGFIAIAINHRNHGNRTIDLAANQANSDNYLANTYGIYSGTALDLVHMLDFLPIALNIPITKIGVVGFSLGAHAAMLTPALDSRISTVVAIGGTADREHMLKIREESLHHSFDISKHTKSILRRYDPIHNIDKYINCSIMMIHGNNDVVVSPIPNQIFIDKLQQLSSNPQNAILDLHLHAGHEITEAMWQNTLKHLKITLINPTPPA
ncbi:MAG: alpha/beta hydrolase family protein [Lentisphaeria bacterium]